MNSAFKWTKPKEPGQFKLTLFDSFREKTVAQGLVGSMPTASDVAEWMFEQFNNTRWMYQESIVYKIKSQFGKDFVYQNSNGNYAIDREVLKQFRKLTEGKAIWERGQRAWRHLREINMGSDSISMDCGGARRIVGCFDEGSV